MDARSRRKLLLYAYGALAGAIALGALGAVISTTQISDLSFSDRLAEISDWVGGGTLLLAALAAVVALQAYAASTGLPDLKFQLRIPISVAGPNEAVFVASQSAADAPIFGSGTSSQTAGFITLRNASGYSAQNPAVVVRLNNLAIPRARFARTDPWIVIEETDDVTAWQWDGGSDYSIHGHSTRRLPEVSFQGLRYLPNSGPPSITFELLAERYRREVTIPVALILNSPSQIVGTRQTESAWL